MADDTSMALIEEEADVSIRREWVGDRWYFSVVDVVGVLTESASPRHYWATLKRRLPDEGAKGLHPLGGKPWAPIKRPPGGYASGDVGGCDNHRPRA